VPIVEQVDHQEVWREAFDTGKIDPVLKRGVLNGFRAGLDHPFFCWYKEIQQMNPTQKVLLSVRDPKKWFNSIQSMNYMLNSISSSFLCSSFLRLVGLGAHADYIKSNLEDTFGLSGRMNKSVRGGEQTSVDFFNAHIEEVKLFVPEDQLLVFDVTEGWEPLCKFLDLPVPDIPFPRINDRRQMTVLFNTIWCVVWITLLGLPLLATFIINMYIDTWAGTVLTLALAAGLVWMAGRFVEYIVGKHAAQKIKKI